MSAIHPKKLFHSKWTAVNPIRKEKHFMVIKVKIDEEGNVEECIIQAVMTKREEAIEWRELKDDKRWLQGWK